MLKRIASFICIGVIMLGMTSCTIAILNQNSYSKKSNVKVGVSFGVGAATRWEKEQVYMEKRAAELGVVIETRLNKTDKPKTQQQDCFEMIDSGIDVLILTPRDASNVGEIIKYAYEHKVKAINYSRLVTNEKVDLFVGYDNKKIGQTLGHFLVELVYKGDYIVLRGDAGDNNSATLYDGAMQQISQIKEEISIILDEAVPGWSPDEAKKMVIEAVKLNGNSVDAIFAPNDKIAGACVEALEELKVTAHVVITGTDAELDAVKRIVAGKQDATVYIDLKELAHTAINSAYNMGTNQKVNVNDNLENGVKGGVDANLALGKLITKKNIDSVLIDSGCFTREEVYGAQ